MLGTTSLNGCKIVLDILRGLTGHQNDDNSISIILNILSIIRKSVEKNIDLANLWIFIGLYETFSLVLDDFGPISFEVDISIMDISISVLRLISSENYLVTEEFARKIGRYELNYFLFSPNSFLFSVILSISQILRTVLKCDSEISLNLFQQMLPFFHEYQEWKRLLSGIFNLISLSLDIFQKKLEISSFHENFIDYFIFQLIRTILVHFEEAFDYDPLLPQALILFSRLLIILGNISSSSMVSVRFQNIFISDTF